EREACDKGVACAVGVDGGAWERRGRPPYRASVGLEERPACRAVGLRDEPRRRLQLDVLLAGIPRAADEHVELYLRRDEHLVRARRSDELPRDAGCTKRLGVAGREVDGVRIAELVPRQRVVAVRAHALADHRDRPLGAGTWSTRANSTHSTWPTTATCMTAESYAGAATRARSAAALTPSPKVGKT